MKIAIIGTRGIPANYGGFETFAENLSIRLARKGHEVTVYGRTYNIRSETRFYKGVKLVILPAIRHKYFETISNTLFSVLHVLFTKTEIIYFCNAINSVFTFIPRMFGKKTIINVNGLEWKRKKWNVLGKTMYKISEFMATIFANKIVTDSMAIHDYYKERFGVDAEYISYGADVRGHISPGPVMEKYGLRQRGYLLYVSRLEPENNAHIVIEAYEKTKGNMPFIVVGDAPYSREYVTRLKATKDTRIRFAGAIYGEGYFELLSNAFLYIHGNEVGGTNPALLEAMACGNCVIVNGVNFNKEVIDGCGIWFEYNNSDSLRTKIEHFLDHPEEADRYRSLAIERIIKYYNWDNVVENTEKLANELSK